MLRLTRKYQNRVSHRMAVLAVFLLVAATMAGVNSTMTDPVTDGGNLAASSESTESPAQAPGVRSVKVKRGFKVNFNLFRHN